MKKLFNDKIIIMKENELKELIELIDKEKEYNNCLIDRNYNHLLKNWDQRTQIKHLQNLIDKTTNYYLKTLAKNGSMPDESVEMYNLLEGNK